MKRFKRKVSSFDANWSSNRKKAKGKARVEYTPEERARKVERWNGCHPTFGLKREDAINVAQPSPVKRRFRFRFPEVHCLFDAVR